MPDSSTLGHFPCEVSLNGMCMRYPRIRQTSESFDDFDIVVTDPQLGSFALHSGFDIEVRELDAAWRQVSLEELKRILKSRYLLPSDDLPTASQNGEACYLLRSMILRFRIGSVAGFPCWAGRKHVFGTFSEFFIAQEFRIWFLERRFWSRALRLLASR